MTQWRKRQVQSSEIIFLFPQPGSSAQCLCDDGFEPGTRLGTSAIWCTTVIMTCLNLCVEKLYIFRNSIQFKTTLLITINILHIYMHSITSLFSDREKNKKYTGATRICNPRSRSSYRAPEQKSCVRITTKYLSILASFVWIWGWKGRHFKSIKRNRDITKMIQWWRH